MSSAPAADVLVRAVSRDDLTQLLVLCVEHAEFERTRIAAPSASSLCEALFSAKPKLYAWVAVDRESQSLGYATATIDFSTWSARSFMHMDCLYVREERRGRGIGRDLVDAVFKHAASLGLAEIQWQTPAWNVDAQRFYERLGARGARKVRFRGLSRTVPNSRTRKWG